MKASELMIGDWVQTNNGASFHVESLADGIIFGIPEEFIDPIPLTEEMLEDNGFLFIADHYSEWYIGNFSIIELEPYNGVMEYKWNYGVIFSFVHQLQHVLRLCGLNELADNFKIE